jgi:hypothetical protein
MILWGLGVLLAGCAGPRPDGGAAAQGDAVSDASGSGGGQTDAEDADLGGPADSDDSSADGPDGTTFEDPPTDDLLDGTDNAEYLDTLAVAHVRAGGQTFLVWVVDEPATRERGLMFVTDEEMADLPDGRSRGMLFVYQRDLNNGFWMRNTITPLDIAFIDAGGAIVTIHTMAPLDESIYHPDGPYRRALEVRAGTFAELGVLAGGLVELP